MRTGLASLPLLCACGNPSLVIENVAPVVGPITETMLRIDDEGGGQVEDTELVFEIDTSQGFCVGMSSGDGGVVDPDACSEEPFGPHYAIITVLNTNEEPVDGGPVGTVQLERYTVDVAELDADAPAINGFTGLLGVSIAPGERKKFAATLLGLDGKAEFRNGGVSTPRRYAMKYTFEGVGGLTAEGGVAVMVGDFARCGDGTPVSFCSPF